MIWPCCEHIAHISLVILLLFPYSVWHQWILSRAVPWMGWYYTTWTNILHFLVELRHWNHCAFDLVVLTAFFPFLTVSWVEAWTWGPFEDCECATDILDSQSCFVMQGVGRLSKSCARSTQKLDSGWHDFCHSLWGEEQLRPVLGVISGSIEEQLEIRPFQMSVLRRSMTILCICFGFAGLTVTGKRLKHSWGLRQ